MTDRRVGHYIRWCSAIAGVGGVTLVVTFALVDPGRIGWAVTGWLFMAAVGVAGGAWAAQAHGRPGPGFLVAMGASMLVRLFLAAAGAAIAAMTGPAAVWPYLAGLGAGFIPTWVFEIGWFWSRMRSPDASPAREVAPEIR